MKETNEFSFNGYVLYAKNNNQKYSPLGIVTQDGKRNAKCTIDSIPTLLSQSLIQIEDIRFYHHIGIDFRGIARAVWVNIKNRKIIEGGSTITQQLARNIFQDNSKTIFRKLREIVFALFIELHYSKKMILELYFNRVFWGKNLYGIRSAGLYYFGKELCKLSKSQQIILLTLLRGPNFYLRHPKALEKRVSLLNKKLFENGISTYTQFKKSKNKRISIENNPLYAFKDTVIPFLKETINEKEFLIYTTLDKKFQEFLSTSISKQKIPLSVIIIVNGKVKAVSSTHGNDYPFVYKSNVGSTLKPFLYSILRKKGIEINEEISTANQQCINWNIREATAITSQYLTIKQALLLSNNNAFVNASFKVGLLKVFDDFEKILPPIGPLTPSIILGSSIKGLSLYELSILYNNYFNNISDEIKMECRDILNENLLCRLNLNIKAGYLKTGTTNDYNERFAVFGKSNLTIGFLTEGYKSIESEDYIKDEDYISVIRNYITNILNLL